VTYHRRNKFNPSYLINPDHIFNSAGYTTIVISDNAQETINPLNFQSKYDAKKFQSAINNKVISDTFNTLKGNKFDLQQILLFLSLAVNFLVLYFIMKSQGIF
jgi:hypothetical protein